MNCKRTLLLAAGVLFIALPISTTQAQVATMLLKTGDPLPGAPGHNITSLHGAATNHAGGYAIRVDTSDGAVTLSRTWGSATSGPGAPLWVEGTYGDYAQTSWESFYGFADAGQSAYSPISNNIVTGSTGLDGVWVDGLKVMNEEEVYPHAAGMWWSFGSRPGITADGTPYFVGGITDTPGGATDNRGLFYGFGTTPLLMGGMVLPNIPNPLSTANSVSFDYRFSPSGNHYLAEVQTTGSTATDAYMVMDGAGVMAGGSVIGEGSPVPAAIGGLPGELWANFDSNGITDSGSYMFTGDTNAATGVDEFICKDGMILYREGQTIDGVTVIGSISNAYMNAQGDITYIWEIVTPAGNVEALFVNDKLLLKEGQEVDIDGDLVPDVGAVVTDFTGTASLAIGDRGTDDMTRIYFTANVDIPARLRPGGDVESPLTTSADLDRAGLSDEDFANLDDPTRVVVEGAFVLSVPTAVPVYLAAFGVEPASDRVVISWQLGDGSDMAVFRLDASQNGATWQVPYQQESAGSFVANDTRAGSGAPVTYSLYVQAAGNDWTLLGRQTANVPTPSLRTQLVGAHPNPFNPQTKISFSVAQPQHVRLVVRDLSGRLVAVLADEAFTAGSHAVDWNGLDVAGRAVASGTYLAQLEADGRTDAKKIQLVR